MYYCCREQKFLLPTDTHITQTQMDTKFIKQIPLFSNLTDEKAQVIADAFESKMFKAGDTIFSQNDEGDGMYGIIFGDAEVLIDEKIITKLGNNDYFGEMALVGFGKRNATVKALSDLSTFFLSKEVFDSIRNELGQEVSDEIMRRIKEDFEKTT